MEEKSRRNEENTLFRVVVWQAIFLTASKLFAKLSKNLELKKLIKLEKFLTPLKSLRCLGDLVIPQNSLSEFI